MSIFCAKVSKRLESGVNDMPQVCEGCTSETKVWLLVERGAFWGKLPLEPRARGESGTDGHGVRERGEGAFSEKCAPLS